MITVLRDLTCINATRWNIWCPHIAVYTIWTPLVVPCCPACSVTQTPSVFLVCHIILNVTGCAALPLRRIVRTRVAFHVWARHRILYTTYGLLSAQVGDRSCTCKGEAKLPETHADHQISISQLIIIIEQLRGIIVFRVLCLIWVVDSSSFGRLYGFWHSDS